MGSEYVIDNINIYFEFWKERLIDSRRKYSWLFLQFMYYQHALYMYVYDVCNVFVGLNYFIPQTTKCASEAAAGRMNPVTGTLQTAARHIVLQIIADQLLQ